MKKLFYIALCMCFAPMMAFAQVYVVAPAGNTGVGTNAPTQKLDVDGNAIVRGNFLNVGTEAGSAAAYLRVGTGRSGNGVAAVDCISNPTAYPLYGYRFGQTGTGSTVMFHRGTSPWLMQATEAASIFFRTASTNRMGILGNGNVTIGSVADNGLLSVAGDIYTTGAVTGPSDKRLKTNVTDFEYGLDEVMELSTIFYNYNGKGGTSTEGTHIGIYAQDLKKVAPELTGEFQHQEVELTITDGTNGTEMEVTENIKRSPDTYLSINQSAIKFMLINAIQEQQAQIEALKEQVQVLSNQINTGGSAASQTVELGSSEAGLLQNQPNPFSEQTTIMYTLPKDAQTANMQITDMSGKVLKTVTLDRNAVNGQLTIKANELGAGTYLYTLIVNGQIMGTKKMILTK